MTTPVEKFKLDFLFKKTLGTPAALGTSYSSAAEAAGSSKSKIIKNLVINQEIPSAAPSTDLSMVDISYTLIPSGNNYDTKQVSTTYPYIAKYTLKLKAASTGFSYYYNDPAAGKNLLDSVIPFNFDPKGTYSYDVKLDGTTVPGSGTDSAGTKSWILDTDSGYLYFPNSDAGSSAITITFWRYEGTYGVGSSSGGVVTGDLSSNGNLFIAYDTSLNSRLVVGSDATVNNRLFIVGDASLNKNVIIGKDLTINGRLNVQNYTNTNIINTTVNNYQLIVSEDLSLNGKLTVANDMSLNGNLTMTGGSPSGPGPYLYLTGAGAGGANTGIAMTPYTGRTSGPAAIINIIDDGTFSGPLVFSVAASGNNGANAATERMRITTSGYVGIATSAPTNFLQIAGSVSTLASTGPDNGSNHNILLTSSKTPTGTNTPYSMALGVDYDTGAGYINAAGNSAHQPVCLNTRGGNVGIGTLTPAHELAVNGTIRVNTANNIRNKLLVLWDGNTAQPVSTATDFYGLGINDGTLRYQTPDTASHRFYTGSTNTTTIASNGVTSNRFNTSSDYRIKENVIALSDTSYSIDLLKPVTYMNKTLGKPDIGFIAHEVQEQIPFLVTGEKDASENQTVNYIGMIGLLTKEIQDLKKENKVLREKIENIELRLSNM